MAGISPEIEPDPARLAEVADLVKKEGVGTIFTEELVSPKVSEALARETGATTAVLSPIEGFTDDDATAGATYATKMRENPDRAEDGTVLQLIPAPSRRAGEVLSERSNCPSLMPTVRFCTP